MKLMQMRSEVGGILSPIFISPIFRKCKQTEIGLYCQIVQLIFLMKGRGEDSDTSDTNPTPFDALAINPCGLVSPDH